MNKQNKYIITAGSSYLDIDAYACMVAMAELLNLQGVKAVAYSKALCNYSVCSSLITEGQIMFDLPADMLENDVNFIIVDVSDPEFVENTILLERVCEVYDHHVGFEDYWCKRIGDGVHIEFIGAAATLIYREWKKSKLTHMMQKTTAQLLIAAILDNTLNLNSSNTTEEDKETFRVLCAHAGVGDEFRAVYFGEVQTNVEADLKNAIFNDIKTVNDNVILPTKVAQLCVWDTKRIVTKLPLIRDWFACTNDAWMINIIDLLQNCSFFVCYDERYQKKIESVFDIHFEYGVAKTTIPYLRKQIIKKTIILMRK